MYLDAALEAYSEREEPISVDKLKEIEATFGISVEVSDQLADLAESQAEALIKVLRIDMRRFELEGRL
jgi:hypothetical protein